VAHDSCELTEDGELLLADELLLGLEELPCPFFYLLFEFLV